ncbi:hypothetical protein RF11_11818 [Thelohanellus kitauei]|uniref:Uncharacterized protein n=1 Tax=Thelohanellus kitauei TaxID=669202 RepID=A0A0C2M4Q7_THEKT|nr:hypothetical protein RF11_11818 [Thelohanellus kitauei]
MPPNQFPDIIKKFCRTLSSTHISNVSGKCKCFIPLDVYVMVEKWKIDICLNMSVSDRELPKLYHLNKYKFYLFLKTVPNIQTMSKGLGPFCSTNDHVEVFETEFVDCVQAKIVLTTTKYVQKSIVKVKGTDIH